MLTESEKGRHSTESKERRRRSGRTRRGKVVVFESESERTGNDVESTRSREEQRDRE